MMSDKKSFEEFFSKFGIEAVVVEPEEVVLEMEEEVQWESALSVGQVWFLFGQDEMYLGHLNDDTMEFVARSTD